MPQKKKKKRSLLQVVNPFDKESKERRLMRKGRRAGKKAAKATRGMTGFDSPPAKKKPVKGLTSASRARKLGVAKGTKVRKGAVGAKKTKGGDFVKYEKGSKSAGKFKTAFKKKCAGGAKSFSWDGRSYSCAKKASPSKKTSSAKKTQMSPLLAKAKKAGLVKMMKK